MTDRKTSTFILHHDRCDPSKWTVSEWSALVNFVRTGSLAYAAQLSRAGLQLKLDDRHVETGGTAEHIGFSPVANNDVQPDYIAETVEDIVDDFLEPTEIAAIYRGPTQYAVRYGIGDEDGSATEANFISGRSAGQVRGDGWRMTVTALRSRSLALGERQ